MKRGRNLPLALIGAAHHGAVEELVWVNKARKRPGHFLSVIEGSDQGNLALDLVYQNDFWKLLVNRTEMNFLLSGAAPLLSAPGKIAGNAHPDGSSAWSNARFEIDGSPSSVRIR